jgi:diadenosine tetraphosphate (Ap4A) HIT family hydrolase
MIAINGFGAVERERILAEDNLFVVARDKYPVSPGHSLVIVKRGLARFQELTADEKARLMTWVDWCIGHLLRTLEPKPDGFNVGLNLRRDRRFRSFTSTSSRATKAMLSTRAVEYVA